MKGFLVILSLLSFYLSAAQHQKVNFPIIDDYVRNISGTRPDSLSYQLTAPWNTDLEKLRAIYSWIAQNIAYNTGIYASIRHYAPKYSFDPLDTMSIWKSGDEMTAI